MLFLAAPPIYVDTESESSFRLLAFEIKIILPSSLIFYWEIVFNREEHKEIAKGR